MTLEILKAVSGLATSKDAVDSVVTVGMVMVMISLDLH